MNFREQAEQYLADAASEVRQNTLTSYRSMLHANVIPFLGEEDLANVDSATAKSLKDHLVEKGLSPATIGLAVWLMTEVVEHATDARGNRLYNPGWNWKFIKMPRKVNQKAPIAPIEAVQEAISATLGGTQALIGLLAGSGLRIGEALALTTIDDGKSNLWDPARGTVLVRATIVGGKLQPAPKTESGNREINLDPALNTFLLKHFTQNTGILFPLSKWTYERRFRAAGLNYGFHSLRRFRQTHLESVGIARMLMKYWTGHAGSDITERYIKFGPKMEERKQKAAEAGLGFQL